MNKRGQFLIIALLLVILIGAGFASAATIDRDSFGKDDDKATPPAAEDSKSKESVDAFTRFGDWLKGLLSGGGDDEEYKVLPTDTPEEKALKEEVIKRGGKISKLENQKVEDYTVALSWASGFSKWVVSPIALAILLTILIRIIYGLLGRLGKIGSFFAKIIGWLPKHFPIVTYLVLVVVSFYLLASTFLEWIPASVFDLSVHIVVFLATLMGAGIKVAVILYFIVSTLMVGIILFLGWRIYKLVDKVLIKVKEKVKERVNRVNAGRVSKGLRNLLRLGDNTYDIVEPKKK